MTSASEAMNSLLLHIAAGPTTSGIPEPRNTEASSEPGSSFSEHLQNAVAASSKDARSDGVVPARTAAKSTLSGAGKTVASNARQRSTEQADPEAAPNSGNDGPFKKADGAGTGAAGSAGKQALNTDGEVESEAGTSAPTSDAGALTDVQSSFAQLVAGCVGKMLSAKAASGTADEPPQSLPDLGTVAGTQVATPVSTSAKAAPGTPEEPPQSLLDGGTVAGTQVAAPVSTSWDFTLAVTQSIAPAETNSAQVSAAPVNCAVEPDSSADTASPQPGPSGETTCPQHGATDPEGSSASAVNAVIAGNNNSAVTMKSAPSDPVLDQTNASDSAVALESPSVESVPAANTKEASPDSPKAADESATTKPSASHDTASAAASASRGAAFPTAEAFTGSVDVTGPMVLASSQGNASFQSASFGRAGVREAQAGSDSPSDVTPARNSQAASTESALADQAPTWSAPPSGWDNTLSVAPNGPLAASGITTGGQNGTAVSVDQLPGASALNVTGSASPASTAVVAAQPGAGPGVVSDPSAKSPAQAEGTARPMQDEVLEAWQNVSAQLERVNGATLNPLPNGTEMRVQMHSDAFGPLEIRATLEGGKIGAAIGVENPEAHHTLLGQVTALQQSLADRHVQLDQVSVVRTWGQSSADFGWNSNQPRDDSAPYSRLGQQARGQDAASEPAIASDAEVGQTENLWGRLSVRA